MVIWKIECDELPGIDADIKCSNDALMVIILLSKGFKRLLKDDVPYQDESLVYTDKKGRVWDAQPYRRMVHAHSIEHMDVLTNRIIQNEAKAKEA